MLPLLLVVLTFYGMLQALPAVVQVQLDENRISQHNDTAYVRHVMRLAKSAEMRNYMQPNGGEVCDNFFQYACGNWAKINPAMGISPRETNFFQLLANAYKHKELQLLQSPPKDNEPNASTFDKAKNFYASCLHFHNDEAAKTPQKFSILLEKLIAEFGYMPMLSLKGQVWPSQEFNWLRTIAEIQQKYGIDIILGFDIAPDYVNKTQNKIYIGQPQLMLGTRSMYNSAVAAYYRNVYLANITRQLVQFLNIGEAQAAASATELLNFEIKLAQGLTDKKSGKSLDTLTQLRRPIAQSKLDADGIDYNSYLQIVLGRKHYNDTFYVYVPEYLRNVAVVVAQTPKRILANYIYYKLVSNFFYNAQMPATEQCLQQTKRFFPRILTNMMYRKFKSTHNQTVNDIDTIWTRIRSIFRAELIGGKSLDWMSPVTRELALKKLEAMRLEINTYENHNFSSFYGSLQLLKTDYFANLKTVQEQAMRIRLLALDGPALGVDAAYALTYSPAYITTENIIKIPVSLLQPNFLWSDHYPQALKFGTLGYLIAHELTHGFDDVGRNFDVHGNHSNWWDAHSIQNFDERKNCFKNQYKRYRYGGKYLPESELQAENIADNAGIQLAYGAYLSWLNETQGVEEEALPNLDFNHRQLFFLSYAQFWCNDVDVNYKDNIALVDTHTPNMFRVNGALANFHVYADEFKCPPGSAMNPSEKCQIYGIK